MIQLRTRSLLLGVLTIAAASVVHADEGAPQNYPEAAVAQIFSQEQIEQKRAEELEAKEAEQQDLLEKKKREAEKEIAAHRFQIENLKMRQEKAQEDLDATAVDLQHANGDLASYQSEHQQLEESSKATIQYLQAQREELAERQKQVDQELAALTDARKKAEKTIYDLSVQIDHYKTDIAKTETKVQAADTQRTELEANEMQVRAEWMNNKMAAAEQAKQRDQALAKLTDAKKRYEQAEKELAQSKSELAKAQVQRNEAARKSQTQVAQYEKDINSASRARIAAESERIRLESEVAKIQDYTTRIKDSRDQAIEDKSDSEGLVLKSSLALESARSALTTTVEKADQDKLKAERAAHQNRGLAAAEQASQLIDGGRVWITSEKCKAYASPDTKNPSGFFDSGKRLLGKDHGSKWVEIMNGSGSSVFVESRCGSFEN